MLDKLKSYISSHFDDEQKEKKLEQEKLKLDKEKKMLEKKKENLELKKEIRLSKKEQFQESNFGRAVSKLNETMKRKAEENRKNNKKENKYIKNFRI